MDLNSLKYIFKETAWMIDPFYKALVLIVYVGGPLTALFVLLLTYTSPNTSIFDLSYYLIESGYRLQIRSITILHSKLFLDLF